MGLRGVPKVLHLRHSLEEGNPEGLNGVNLTNNCSAANNEIPSQAEDDVARTFWTALFLFPISFRLIPLE